MNPEHQVMSESNVGENMVRVSQKYIKATPKELTNYSWNNLNNKINNSGEYGVQVLFLFSPISSTKNCRHYI